MPKCKKCELLEELYEAAKEHTPRLYWVMTELFVLLHGSDVCKGLNDREQSRSKP